VRLRRYAEYVGVLFEVPVRARDLWAARHLTVDPERD
jgi:hypothetical protein